MSETKTKEEVVASNPIETGEVTNESKSDYKVDLKTGTTKKQEASTVTKVDLTKKPEQDAVQVGETKEVVVGEQAGDSPKVDEQISEPSKATEDFKQIQEITKEEVKKVENVVEEAIRDEKVLGKQLPENVEKLVSFMEETGGTVEDYVRLSADYSNVDGQTLLKEYYKKSKPHLNDEEIGFIMEDNFSYDEEIDDEREVRKKKLALKEEVAKAHGYLEELKGKYYDEIKLRPGVTQEQQKATDFFNRYNKQQETAEQQHAQFKESTKELFNDNFEGFDIKVGEKSYKYNIQNRDKVAESQSNINNLVGKFLDSDGNVKDTKGYHKAMYAADNVDKIAAHFYEQGKADAVKEVVSSSKNLSSTKARSTQGEVFLNGFKVKAISGADSTKLRIKTKKFN